MAHPKIKNQAEALAIARRYVAAVCRSGLPVEQALLFGSFAKQTQHVWSDVDVAVVSPVFGRDRCEERIRLMRLGRTISSAIEPHPFHPDDLKNRWSTIAQEIREHGIPIRW